ncbi:MAG: protein kinase [Deltaproteobacteria bacterium]|nr:protein kinase [Deltaproteobacteria bacterium]
MAEIFVARREGLHGFSKRVALKRILPQFSSDPDFVWMFIDEARLAALLEHPNIVQVFDFGTMGDDLVLVMELVDGSNVSRVLRTASEDLPIPWDVALHIAYQTAQALDYAHHAVDDKGEPLEFVHRDVSPANILLSRTGHVKLTDFGIATVRSRAPTTEDGQVRGKLGYMSPEQVLGKELSGKSDVFTLSTVLAEMLIGEPLFQGESELNVLLQIRSVRGSHPASRHGARPRSGSAPPVPAEPSGRRGPGRPPSRRQSALLGRQRSHAPRRAGVDRAAGRYLAHDLPRSADRRQRDGADELPPLDSVVDDRRDRQPQQQDLKGRRYVPRSVAPARAHALRHLARASMEARRARASRETRAASRGDIAARLL